MGFEMYKRAPEGAMFLEKIYYQIDNFVDNLNQKYLEMRQDLGIDSEHDIFDVESWNFWRREMKTKFSEEGIDRDRWVELLKGIIRVKNEDLSSLVLGDHDLDGIFSAAEELLMEVEKIA